MSLLSRDSTTMRLIFVMWLLLPLLGSGALGQQPARDLATGLGKAVAKPTGRFQLARVKNRELLVTPQGHPFVALGVNHIGVIAKQRPAVDWTSLLADYRSWGCTAVGNGGVTELTERMPYIAARNIIRTSKYYSGPTGNNPYDYADVFDPAIQSRLSEEVRQLCLEHRDDPLLVGYCWTDTPCWDIVRTRALRRTDWVTEIRRLAESAPGKQRYVDFLRQRYADDIGAFSRAYRMPATTFEELLASDFSALDPASLAALRDDQEFLAIIARQYYKTVGTAQRTFDPDHLVFGEKYLAGDCPDAVLRAALPYIDVLSIQPGDGYIDVYPGSDLFLGDYFDRLYELTGKPIFICDHQISFPTRQYPLTTWTQLPGETEAAAATQRFILEAFAKPYIVGYMRCQYIDAFDHRRGGLKQGLLRQDRSPYEKALAAFRAANHEVQRRLVRELEAD